MTGIELDVLGATGDPFLQPETAVLFGVSTGGEDISLLGAREQHATGTLGGLGRHRWAADVLVRGKHLANLDEFMFTRGEIRLRGLREILWHPRHGAIGMDADARDEASRRIVVPGAALTMTLGWDVQTSRHERRQERIATVELVLDEPVNFDQWMANWVEPLRDLVVFATREPSRVEAVAAIVDVEQEPLWWKPNAPRTSETHRVEFARRQSQLLAEERPDYRRVLFWMGELVGDQADDVINRWLALHRRLTPSAGFLFSTLTTRMFLEQRLISLTSAAEGYHRVEHGSRPLDPARHDTLVTAMLDQCGDRHERHVYEAPLKFANDMSQRKRLRALYERAATALPELGADVAPRIAALVDTRNYFIHQDQRGPRVMNGPELAAELERLIVVLQANLLLDIGFPAPLAKDYLRRAYEGHSVLGIR